MSAIARGARGADRVAVARPRAETRSHSRAGRPGRARGRAVARARDAASGDDARATRRAVVGGVVVSVASVVKGARAEEDVVEAPAEDAAATWVPSEAPRAADDALSAYERATRTGGNSKTAKAIAGRGTERTRATGGGDEASGFPFGILAAIPAIGAAGFAATKALGGGNDEDEDEDEDVPVRPRRGEPVNAPKVEKPKAPERAAEARAAETPKPPAFSMPKMEMPSMPSLDLKSRLPPDAPRAAFPKRAEIWASEMEEEEQSAEAAEEADREAREARRAAREAEREAEKAEREAERAQREAEREVEKAEREAARAAREAEREAREAEREREEQQRAAAKERARRDRSAEEADAAERKAREKQLIEQEREAIKAAKAARAAAKAAERETQVAERANRAALREEQRRLRDEQRRAEREARQAGTQLIKGRDEKSSNEERSFTQWFKRSEEAPISEPVKPLTAKTISMPKLPILPKTQAMKKEKTPTAPVVARTQQIGRSQSDEEIALPAGFPTVGDLKGLTKEEKLALADEAEAFAERLATKADAAEKFANGPVAAVLFFLKPGAIKSAERARAVADLAEGEAALVRAAAERGDFPVALVGAFAALALAGGAALLVSGGDAPTISLPSTPTIKIERATLPKAEMPSFFGQSKEAPSPSAEAPLRDLAAMEAMEKLANGEGDALDLYEQMSRR